MNTVDWVVLFDEFPVLDTERLRLRRLEESDAAAMLAFWSDPEVTAFLDGPVLTTRDDTLDIIRWSHDITRTERGARWGITLKDQDVVIGTCGFHSPSKHNFRAEIGYELARPYWRKGLMREALTAVITFGRDQMGLHRIEALVDPHNEPSRAILRSLGFAEEGLLCDYQYYLDKFHTMMMLSLIHNT